MTTLRIGLVGCGTIAYWSHLPSLRSLRDTRLVAVADPDPEARARFSRFVAGATHEDPAELFARADVDAVVLATPPSAHVESALAACRARKPFYLEKPIALALADARRVLDAAAEHRVLGVIGFNRRRHPIHERAREIVAAGGIGAVHAVLSAFCEPPFGAALAGWRLHRASGGGALRDLGSHHVDLVRWLLEDEVVEAQARITSQTSEDDSAWVRLATARGVEVRSVYSSRCGPADWISLLGERGTLLVDRFRCRLEWRRPRRFGYGLRAVRSWPRAGNLGWRLRRLARPSHEPSYRRALAAFVAEVRGGPPATARLADGARSLEVVLAAEESARAGRAIAVDELA